MSGTATGCTDCCWQFDFYGPFWPGKYQPGAGANGQLHEVWNVFFRSPAIWPAGWDDPYTQNSSVMVGWQIGHYTDTDNVTLCTLAPYDSGDLVFAITQSTEQDGYNYQPYRINLFDAQNRTLLWAIEPTEFFESDTAEPANNYGPFIGNEILGTGREGKWCTGWEIRDGGFFGTDGPELAQPLYLSVGAIHGSFAQEQWMTGFARVESGFAAYSEERFCCDGDVIAWVNTTRTYQPSAGVFVSPIVEWEDGNQTVHWSKGITQDDYDGGDTVTISNPGTEGLGSLVGYDRYQCFCPHAYPWVFGTRPPVIWEFENTGAGSYTKTERVELFHGRIVPGSWDWDLLDGDRVSLEDEELWYSYERERETTVHNDPRRLLINALYGDRDEAGNAAVAFFIFEETLNEFDVYVIEQASVIQLAKPAGGAVTVLNTVNYDTNEEGYAWSLFSDTRVLRPTHQDYWIAETAPGPLVAGFAGVGAHADEDGFYWLLTIYDIEVPELYASLQSAATSTTDPVVEHSYMFKPFIQGSNDKYFYVHNFPLYHEATDSYPTSWRFSHDLTVKTPFNIPAYTYDPRINPNPSLSYDGGQWDGNYAHGLWTDCVHDTQSIDYPPQ